MGRDRRDTLDASWLKTGFKVGPERPSPTMRVRDHLQELSGKKLRLVKMESYGHSTGYYLREGQGPGEPQAQYIMAIDENLPSLVLGISVEKGEERREAAASRRMHRKTWAWGSLVKLRQASFEGLLSGAAKATKRPLSVIVWTDREDDDQEWHFTFAYGRWLQRAVPCTAQAVIDRLHLADAQRDHWCDVWIGCELGPEDVGRTTLQETAALLHAFSALRERLHP